MAGQAQNYRPEGTLTARELAFEGLFGAIGRGPGPIRHLVAKPGELPLGVAAGVHDRAGGGLVERDLAGEMADRARARHAPSSPAARDRACARPAPSPRPARRPAAWRRSAPRCARTNSRALAGHEHLGGAARHRAAAAGPRGASRRASARSPAPLPARARCASGRCGVDALRRRRIAPRQLGVQRRRRLRFAGGRAPARGCRPGSAAPPPGPSVSALK